MHLVRVVVPHSKPRVPGHKAESWGPVLGGNYVGSAFKALSPSRRIRWRVGLPSPQVSVLSRPFTSVDRVACMAWRLRFSLVLGPPLGVGPGPWGPRPPGLGLKCLPLCLHIGWAGVAGVAPAALLRLGPLTHKTTWLILPAVICLSQRLSHACLSINCFVL